MLERNNPKFRELIEKGIPIERLERRLRPELRLGNKNAEISQHDGFGDYSDQGFLGVYENLLDVVHEDWMVVEGYGTTHKEIAESLTKAINTQKMPNSKYAIQHRIASGGLQTCPWECDGKYQRGNGIILIYNVQKTSREDLLAASLAGMLNDRLSKKMKEELAGENEMLARILRNIPENKDAFADRVAVVTELHPHLIGEHYFFEGKQSRYRANPEVLMHALDLARCS